ncbi:MAG TPA: DUF3302 domain-containing protein [Vicinamibacterales bacterium]|jgi:hypothetical protein|nr:DUF3302 domain-containing protein [Vicinamibacterales bacterium]
MHLSGPVVDTIADYLTIVVLVVVPPVLIYLFWIVHIMPEKIAERRGHPQLDAIKTLCLLSLVFGGLLWPIAWLWAFSRPVMHQMAYGTDRIPHDKKGGDGGDAGPRPVTGGDGGASPAAAEAVNVKRPAAALRD